MTETEDKYAIHAASREGRLGAVEALLNANPRLSQRADGDERLPVHWACAYNHLAIVSVLASQRSFDGDATDSAGWTPLHISASLPANAGLEVMQLLLAKEADAKLATTSGGTALHFAASKGNLAVCALLLKNGASARVRDKRGMLPLHRAAAVGSVPVLKVLLDARSPVDAQDGDGWTALHHAVSEGHGDVAVELLRRGAESKRADKEGKVAIEYAPDARVGAFIRGEAEKEGIDL